MDNKRKVELSIVAAKAKKHALNGIFCAQSGHPGGSLSIMDVLVTLFFDEMNIDPKSPNMPNRDRFVLSKGHCAPGLYAVLAERGFFAPEELGTLRRIDSFLQGHPDMKSVPGVDMSTGSLGQGVSAANGMALAAKLDGAPYRVYVATGDGELEEGQVWEAAMFAPHYKLDNLTLFVDSNGLQIDGEVAKVMNPGPIADKYRAFGWNVIEIDGNDYIEISGAIAKAKSVKGVPTAVICKTVKGNGISYMENNAGWHGKAPNKDEFEKAIAELNAEIARLEKELN